MKILHSTDFSDCAQQAEAAAADLVGKLGGEIVLLQVLVETALYGEGIPEHAEGPGRLRRPEQVDGGGARGAGHFTSPARDEGELAGESWCAIRGDRQNRRGGAPSFPC